MFHFGGKLPKKGVIYRLLASDAAFGEYEQSLQACFFLFSNTGISGTSKYMKNAARLDGSKLTKWMKANGVSYEGLAGMIGLSPGTVRQMAKGYLPSRNREGVLAALSEAMRVSSASLLVRSG